MLCGFGNENEAQKPPFINFEGGGFVGRKKKETGFILFSAENIDRHTLGHSNFRPKILFPLGDFFSSHFQLV